MRLTAVGVALVKTFEQGPDGGAALFAYQDVGGVWTIGYGHTAGVKEGDTCTQEQADAWLLEDLGTADAMVSKNCPTATDAQHDAMVSLCYNIGMGNFRGCSVCRFHEAGYYAQAADAFGLWVHAGGKVEPGLVTRRKIEAAMYRGEPQQEAA